MTSEAGQGTGGAHDEGAPVAQAGCEQPPDLIEQFAGQEGCTAALRDAASSLRLSADNLHSGVEPAGPGALETGAELVARGVRVRVLYPSEVLLNPGHRRYLEDLTEVGVEVRVLDQIAHDMMIFDGRVVCLPSGKPSDALMLRISRSMLVRSFVSIYETYWERATPVPLALLPLVPLPAERAELDLREFAVVQLMTRGGEDEEIAAQLGLPPHEVTGVVGSLMERLGASSRFELGFKLARRMDPHSLPDTDDSAGPAGFPGPVADLEPLAFLNRPGGLDS